MTTNIWLKSQPNKQISYPDCFPMFARRNLELKPFEVDMVFIGKSGQSPAEYMLIAVERIEFRP